MRDHGELEDFELYEALGEKLMEIRETLDGPMARIAGPETRAVAWFEVAINDVWYKVTMEKVEKS